MELFTRHRRLRQNAWIRELSAEYRLHPSNLIQPLFLQHGSNIKTPITSLDGQYRLSLDLIIEELKRIRDLGIPICAIFPCIDAKYKNDKGDYATNESNYLFDAIADIKAKVPGIGLMLDVALDPYTSHGHDGVLDKNSNVDNDKTVAKLCTYSSMLAKAGADIVAPSDMMDGRIEAIRSFTKQAYPNLLICSYAVKFASHFYGPFRDAVASHKYATKIDKSTYQVDFRNCKEAYKEIFQDIDESADMVIIKPGLPYLDIIANIKNDVFIPIIAYQVSGEYGMLKTAAKAGYLDFDNAMLETLIAMKRAGANAIISYAASEVAKSILPKTS